MADGIPGQEIGYAEVASPSALVGFALTTSDQVVGSLMTTVTVPTSCRIHVEAYLPLVINNAVANNLNLSIVEDGVFVAFAKMGMAASATISLKAERTLDARPGSHLYWVSASLTGGTATTYGGFASPYTFVEYLRVVVC